MFTLVFQVSTVQRILWHWFVTQLWRVSLSSLCRNHHWRLQRWSISSVGEYLLEAFLCVASSSLSWGGEELSEVEKACWFFLQFSYKVYLVFSNNVISYSWMRKHTNMFLELIYLLYGGVVVLMPLEFKWILCFLSWPWCIYCKSYWSFFGIGTAVFVNILGYICVIVISFLLQASTHSCTLLLMSKSWKSHPNQIVTRVQLLVLTCWSNPLQAIHLTELEPFLSAWFRKSLSWKMTFQNLWLLVGCSASKLQFIR